MRSRSVSRFHSREDSRSFERGRPCHSAHRSLGFLVEKGPHITGNTASKLALNMPRRKNERLAFRMEKGPWLRQAGMQ